MQTAWQRNLANFLRPGAVLVGVGNRLRGDDACGPLLADRLRGRIPWAVCDAATAPENTIGLIARLCPTAIIFLDAVSWGAPAGQIGFFPEQAIPWGGISTHAVSLRLLAAFLREDRDTPVALLGVQPAQMVLGTPPSAAVRAAVASIACWLIRAGGRRNGAPAAGDAPGGPAGPLPAPAFPRSRP